jgi:hypothetical protein
LLIEEPKRETFILANKFVSKSLTSDNLVLELAGKHFLDKQLAGRSVGLAATHRLAVQELDDILVGQEPFCKLVVQVD